MPAVPNDTMIYAVRAFRLGEANEGQQRALWNWIMQDVCRYTDLSYRPDNAGGTLATAFAEGRRFVAIQLLRLIEPDLTPRGQKPKDEA